MEKYLEKRPQAIPCIVAAVFLLLALLDWPYGYYVFLRWIVCISAGFISYKAFEWKIIWATWLFGFIALLFNPLVPIYLSKPFWIPIDLICALMFIVSLFILREPK